MISFVKAKVTGERYDGGENEKIGSTLARRSVHHSLTIESVEVGPARVW